MTSNYRNVLAAVDLTQPSAGTVLAGAREFLGKSGALHVLHVVEPQYVQYSFDPTIKGTLSRSLEQETLEAAAARLAELCEPLGIDADHRHVVLGRASDSIHELAKRQGSDLIVVGSHGREGWRRLLGSTANAVLHGSPVDVATIRIHGEDDTAA
jgi:universal stress protein A